MYKHHEAPLGGTYMFLVLAGTDLGGSRGPVPPLKTFYLYVTATINSMKISFNDV